jgi:hypothetical protein
MPTFDWTTMTDVVLHVRYTAREGGDLLREAALASISLELSEIPLRRAFSAKHEFPTEWSAFLRPAQGGSEPMLKLDLSEKRFPYFARALGLNISDLQLVALVKDPENAKDITADVEGAGTTNEGVTLASADGIYDGNPSANIGYQEADPGEWKITVDTSTLGAPSEWIDDLVVIATYQVSVPI